MQQKFYKLSVKKTNEHSHYKCNEQKKIKIRSSLLLTINGLNKITKILQAQINR